MTTEEGNKLIAEFMGATIRVSPKYGELYKFTDRTGEYGKHAIPIKYNSSWDWLLPVWKKVIGVIGLEMYCRSDRSSRLWLEKSKEIEMDIITTNISGAFNKITQLIKWYNESKESLSATK